jgi:hypothetical protein
MSLQTGSDLRVGRAWRRRVSAAVLSCTALLGLADAASSAPFVPTSGEEILERLPPREGAEWQAIAALHEQLARDPRSANVLAPQLVQRYLELFRVQGDPRLIAYAQRELAPWITVSDPPIAVALARAEIAQLTHRFDEARADLQRLLEREPREPQAWLMLAALDLVRADYAASRRACTRLVLLQDATVAGACVAAVQALTGEGAAALSFLERALEPGSVDDDLAVWLETLAAETAEALGDDDAALAHYRAAVARGVPSIYLQTAYADCLLRAGRADAAVALLENAPPADPILLRLAFAQKRLGRSAAGTVERLSYRLELSLQGVEIAHAREAAYFALNLLEQPELALERSLANWQTQREPIDARLVLEAALAARRPAAARPVVEWLAANRVQHAELERLRARLAP